MDWLVPSSASFEDTRMDMGIEDAPFERITGFRLKSYDLRSVQ
jgi:hypothetical protein